MRVAIIALLTILTAGCVTFYEPVPPGYSGELAEIRDSYSDFGSRRAHYFMLLKVDGKEIAGSYGETRMAHIGQGMVFTPSMVTRFVMAKEQKFTLQGIVFFPTDAQALMFDEMEVTKEITFTPKAGEVYTVRGKLDKKGSTVWLEDSSGKTVD